MPGHNAEGASTPFCAVTAVGVRIDPAMQHKAAFLIASILLTATAVSAHAAAPVLTGSMPQYALVADDPTSWSPGIHPFELDGNNMTLPTTNGFTFQDDLLAYVKYSTDSTWTQVRNGDPWARPTSYSPYSYSFTLTGLHTGYLDIYYCVRTQGCAYKQIFIRAWSNSAPYLFSPDNTNVIAFTSSDSPNDTRRLTYFSSSDLNDMNSTCFYISGYGVVTGIGYIYPGDGYGVFWMPNLAPGDHTIWVSNNGCYAPRWSNGRVIHAQQQWTIKGGPGPFGF